MKRAILNALRRDGASTAAQLAAKLTETGKCRKIGTLRVIYWLRALEHDRKVWRINPGHTPLIWRIEE